jgi:hypothetical protein
VSYLNWCSSFAYLPYLNLQLCLCQALVIIIVSLCRCPHSPLQFYDKNGQEAPGQKGLTLSEAAWTKLTQQAEAFTAHLTQA